MQQLNFKPKPPLRLLSQTAYWVPPLLLSVTIYGISPNPITRVQFLLAFLLLQVPWTAYLNWKKRPVEKLPIFAIVSFMYWVYFALGLYWGARTPSGIRTPSEREVSDEAITWALSIALIGVIAMWFGMKMRLGRYFVSRRLPELKPGLNSGHYIRLLLVGGTLLSSYDSVPSLAGEGGRQALSVIISTVPLLAFCILFQKLLRREADTIDKALVLAFLGLRLVIGLSSGWLGSFAAIIVICAAMFVAERKRIPRLVVLVVIMFTLFFQIGKKEFRNVYWGTDTETSKVDRVKFWTEVSLNKWEEALSDPSGSALNEAMESSLARVSLLTQTANVIDLTPAVVPYQGGHLYSYLLITLVPRAVWPDKPSMNEANQFYQVAYGLSTEDDLQNISIAVGVLTESYISFGVYGVVLVMFLMGIFYDIYRRLFFDNSSNLLMIGIGIALLPQIMALESQMAAYLGGIVQQTVFTLVIFLPVVTWKSFPARERSSFMGVGLAAAGRSSN